MFKMYKTSSKYIQKKFFWKDKAYFYNGKNYHDLILNYKVQCPLKIKQMSRI